MNINERPQSEQQPRDPLHSSLSGKTGHGSRFEKRASMQEPAARLKEILSSLPPSSRSKLGAQADYIRKNPDPEQAVDIIRKELELQLKMLDPLDTGSASIEDALYMLDELFPEEPKTVQ